MTKKKKRKVTPPKNSALDELDEIPRRVTPLTLHGAKLKLWKAFLVRYNAGDYEGVGWNEIHAWAQKHLGLTCTIFTTKRYIEKALEAGDD